MQCSKDSEYKCEVMLCLWFVIHMGKTFIQEAQALYRIDPICGIWLDALKDKGKEDIAKFELERMDGNQPKEE